MNIYKKYFSGVEYLKWIKNTFLFILLAFSGHVYAEGYTGFCSAVGGTAAMRADVGSVEINQSNNYAGNTVDPLMSWTSLGNYTVSCDCESNWSGTWIFSTRMTLPATSDSGWFYLSDVFSVSLSLEDRGNHLVMPFDNYRTGGTTQTNVCAPGTLTLHGGSTGTVGSMAIKLNKALDGRYSLNNIHMASLWICYGDSAMDCTTNREANIDYYFSGFITSPENCTINAGTIINVDLGTIFSGNFKGAKQKPVNNSPHKVSVPVTCTNGVDASAIIQFRISATADENYSDAVKTSNPGLGVLIEDQNGNLITPNTGSASVQLTEHQSTFDFQVSPVSTTGTFTEQGQFTAVATIVAEID